MRNGNFPSSQYCSIATASFITTSINFNAPYPAHYPFRMIAIELKGGLRNKKE